MSRHRYAVELWSWAGEFYGRIAIYRTKRRAARHARRETRADLLDGQADGLWVVVRI